MLNEGICSACTNLINMEDVAMTQIPTARTLAAIIRDDTGAVVFMLSLYHQIRGVSLCVCDDECCNSLPR
jgi:hypothetical protein